MSAVVNRSLLQEPHESVGTHESSDEEGTS